MKLYVIVGSGLKQEMETRLASRVWQSTNSFGFSTGSFEFRAQADLGLEYKL
jgi:hypothetical protein